jgi:RNA polymerase primary sigma factor
MSKANKSETVLSPLEEKLVKELVTEGREKGFVTIDEINENLGDETPSPEQLEKIFDIFSEMDIEVVDSEKKTELGEDNTDSRPETDLDESGLDLYGCIYVRWAVSSC